MTHPTILVVEDDAAIRRGQVDALRFAGYQVLEAAEGPEAMRQALGASLDLVLLDVMLPGMNGFDLLVQLRRTRPALPVIMVTARGSEDDRVRGLRDGADDYVVKPFSARELLARVEAVLRRSPARPNHHQGPLTVHGRSVHLEEGEIRFQDGTSRALSQREGEILHYLASCIGQVVSRQELLERVWGLDPRGVETRTVDMHIARLREKLADDSGEGIIKTVRSRGYMLIPEPGAVT